MIDITVTIEIRVLAVGIILRNRRSTDALLEMCEVNLIHMTIQLKIAQDLKGSGSQRVANCISVIQKPFLIIHKSNNPIMISIGIRIVTRVTECTPKGSQENIKVLGVDNSIVFEVGLTRIADTIMIGV